MRNQFINYPLMIAFMPLFYFPGFTTLYAQSFTVTGTVSDAQGGIPGVNVTIKGSAVGTVTDKECKFSLDTEYQTHRR